MTHRGKRDQCTGGTGSAPHVISRGKRDLCRVEAMATPLLASRGNLMERPTLSFRGKRKSDQCRAETMATPLMRFMGKLMATKSFTFMGKRHQCRVTSMEMASLTLRLQCVCLSEPAETAQACVPGPPSQQLVYSRSAEAQDAADAIWAHVHSEEEDTMCLHTSMQCAMRGLEHECHVLDVFWGVCIFAHKVSNVVKVHTQRLKAMLP